VLVRLDHVIARDYFKLEERVASAIFVIDIRSCTVRINSESGKKMEPFQQQFNVSVDAGLTSGSALETVPAGKLAVIEHVSVSASGFGNEKADYFIISTLQDNTTFRDVPIVTKPGVFGVIGSHSVRAFAAPETRFGAVIRRLDTGDRIGASFIITGHFEPVA
jgi:hypothetical protein